MRGIAADARWWIVALALSVAGCTRAPAPSPAPAARAVPAVSTSARSPRAPRAPATALRAAEAATPAYLDDVASVSDTFDTLRRRYGDANVRRETLPGGEGSEVAGWVLFADDPKRRIDVYPDEAGMHPALLLVRANSAWTRSDGVRIGLDTRALERMNGGAFQFVGFDWDYGGVIDDWKGGRLARDGRFLGPVQLCPPPDTPEDYPAGDAEFMSDLPVVRAHPATVCELGVSLQSVDAAGASERAD